MFVPDDFEPPRRLVTEHFVLEPLGPEHNERDHVAWSSSIEHIHATPGYRDDPPDAWPTPMSLDENLADLEMHARHFRDREGFTYTVLERVSSKGRSPGGHPSGADVVGCVYIYPDPDEDGAARVRSWVRASHAALDGPLWLAVSDWLASDAWPFRAIHYAARG